MPARYRPGATASWGAGHEDSTMIDPGDDEIENDEGTDGTEPEDDGDEEPDEEAPEDDDEG